VLIMGNGEIAMDGMSRVMQTCTALDWHPRADFSIVSAMKTSKQKPARAATSSRTEPTQAARILILPKKGSPLGEARIRAAVKHAIAERERQSA